MNNPGFPDNFPQQVTIVLAEGHHLGSGRQNLHIIIGPGTYEIAEVSL